MELPFLLLNTLTSDSLACKRQQNAFLSTPSGLALSLESFATKSARTGLMRRQQREPLYLITRLHEPGSIAGTSRPRILVDRPLSFVACIAGRSLASRLRFGERLSAA